jgi:hypothetical protein
MISSINDIYSQGRAGARVKSLNPGINVGGGGGNVSIMIPILTPVKNAYGG